MVEDDFISKDVTALYLKELCKIDHAPNADAALEMIKNNTYDAILMDINLGMGMNGLELTRVIRKMPDYTSTPIIAVTAYAMKGEKEKFLEGGCSHYLSKPYSKKDIVNLMSKVLG